VFFFVRAVASGRSGVEQASGAWCCSDGATRKSAYCTEVLRQQKQGQNNGKTTTKEKPPAGGFSSDDFR